MLRSKVRARGVTREDLEYDGARAVHNGMIDKHPLAIVKAEQVADVMAAVDFARESGFELSVRGGGHSAPGFGITEVVSLSI